MWTSGNIVIHTGALAGRVGYWSQADFTANAITLLHELGHYYADVAGMGGSAIRDDAEDPALSLANTALINSNCFPGVH